MKTQFITNEKGEKISVILSIKDFEQIIENLEELEDIKSYDKVKESGDAFEPFADYLRNRNNRKSD